MRSSLLLVLTVAVFVLFVSGCPAPQKTDTSQTPATTSSQPAGHPAGQSEAAQTPPEANPCGDNASGENPCGENPCAGGDTGNPCGDQSGDTGGEDTGGNDTGGDDTGNPCEG